MCAAVALRLPEVAHEAHLIAAVDALVDAGARRIIDGRRKRRLALIEQHEIEGAGPKDVQQDAAQFRRVLPERKIGFKTGVGAVFLRRHVNRRVVLSVDAVQRVAAGLEQVLLDTESREDPAHGFGSDRAGTIASALRVEQRGRLAIQLVHQHFHGHVAGFAILGSIQVVEVQVVFLFLAEAHRLSGQQLVQRHSVFMKTRRLPVREDLVLALENEEVHVLGGNVLQQFGHRIDEASLAAGDHQHLVLEDEQARLGQQVRVAVLGRHAREDVRPRGLDDLAPAAVAQSTQTGDGAGNHQLDFFLGAFEEWVGHRVGPGRILPQSMFPRPVARNRA